VCIVREQAAGSSARLLIGRAVALLAPPRCLACDSSTAIGAVLCGACHEALARLPAGTPAARRADALSAHFAAFPMVWPARDLVHALKYRSAVTAARTMAALLADRAPPALLADAALVPAPAHPARLRQRGYNQSALLAHEFARITGLPVCDCLVRSRAAPPQTGLPRGRRLALDPSTVRVRPRALRWPARPEAFPTKVLVLDDVATTGVTLEVCALAIRRRFGSEVRAITFASTSAYPG
jgi:predicted amidophosphoribosyltransferase